jgi:signal transduction histidine kinase
LRQHVASATTHCGMLARRLTGDTHNMAILNEIVESVKALEMIVDGLSDYASDQTPHCESVGLKRLVDEVLDTLQPRLSRQKVVVEVHVPTTLTLEVDRRMMAAAVRHLTHSALATMPAGGQLVITAVSSPLGLELEVADSGPGLSEEEMPRAFAATHHSPVGTSGMERAIARHVVSAHGGKITARNCPEGGAAFTLLFPSRRAQQAA